VSPIYRACKKTTGMGLKRIHNAFMSRNILSGPLAGGCRCEVGSFDA